MTARRYREDRSPSASCVCCAATQTCASASVEKPRTTWMRALENCTCTAKLLGPSGTTRNSGTGHAPTLAQRVHARLVNRRPPPKSRRAGRAARARAGRNKASRAPAQTHRTIRIGSSHPSAWRSLVVMNCNARNGRGKVKTQCGFPAGRTQAATHADGGSVVVTCLKQHPPNAGAGLHDQPQSLGARIGNADLQKPDDDRSHCCASVYG
jgi:hypothetical protein